MCALPWQTTPQPGLNRPIRTFNDEIAADDFNRTRILEWVREPHPEEEKLTPEQRAMIRVLDWDDYHAVDDEDRADPIAADYLDYPGIDYIFENDSSSSWGSSQARHSARTRNLSPASRGSYPSPTQPELEPPVPEIDPALAEGDVADDNASLSGNESVDEMGEPALEGEEETLGSKHISTPVLTAINDDFIEAAQTGDEGWVKQLLESGANIESRDRKYRLTPLSWAARNGHEKVVKLLLESGANIEFGDMDDDTPLLLAARNGYEKVVKQLLESGANIESQDESYDRTPLLLATKYGHEKVVKLLLESGANIDSKDISGQTSLSLAVEYGHKAIVKLLLEHGAILESEDEEDDQAPAAKER